MGKAFAELLGPLVASYKNDPESVYNTWFVGSAEHLYLVAPRSREREIIEQMRRPCFNAMTSS